MKNKRLPVTGLIAALVLSCGFASADNLGQPVKLATSTATYTGSGSGGAANPDFFTATVEPFDPSLGELVSFTFIWEGQGTMTGTVSTGGGYVSGFFGGTLSLNDISFDGYGSPEGGASGGAGASLSATYTLAPYSKTRLVAESGATYNPLLLAAITGDAPYVLKARNGTSCFAQMEYGNMATMTSTLTGKITVTYNYIPAAPVADSSLKISGVSHNAVAASNSLVWSSQDGKTYSVDASDNLTDWEVLKYGVAATAPSNSFTESSLNPDATKRFYRVRSRE